MGRLEGAEGLLGHLDVLQIRRDVHLESTAIDFEHQRAHLTTQDIRLVEMMRLGATSRPWASGATSDHQSPSPVVVAR